MRPTAHRRSSSRIIISLTGRRLRNRRSPIRDRILDNILIRASTRARPVPAASGATAAAVWNPQQQQPYPGQPQYSQQQPYPQQPQAPAYQYANGPVTIPQGTLLQLRTSEPLASKKAVDGNPVQFTVIQDVTMGGVLAIPRGAVVHGVVSEIKKSGELGGSPELALTLTSLDLAGRRIHCKAMSSR